MDRKIRACVEQSAVLSNVCCAFHPKKYFMLNFLFLKEFSLSHPDIFIPDSGVHILYFKLRLFDILELRVGNIKGIRQCKNIEIIK